jgi:hypothetical protein
MAVFRHPYEFPYLDVAWTRGGDPAAGIFLLAGRCHIAAYDSPAARALVDGGALHVAGVRFDAEPRERSHAGRSVRRVTATAWLDARSTNLQKSEYS